MAYLLCFRYLPASPGELCSSEREKGENAVRFIIDEDANRMRTRDLYMPDDAERVQRRELSRVRGRARAGMEIDLVVDRQDTMSPETRHKNPTLSIGQTFSDFDP